MNGKTVSTLKILDMLKIFGNAQNFVLFQYFIVGGGKTPVLSLSGVNGGFCFMVDFHFFSPRSAKSR